MTGVLIADTVQMGEGIPAPTLLVKALSIYLERVRSRSLPQLQLPNNLAEVNWGQTWQDYVQLLATAEKEVATITYAGSLGDEIDGHSTLADLCSDWRLSVLLTLPLLPNALSLAAAYAALANQTNSRLLGIVLIGDLSSESHPLAGRIQDIVRVPVVGYLSPHPQDSTYSEKLAKLATGFNWELLPW